jgi:hypothetical protein
MKHRRRYIMFQDSTQHLVLSDLIIAIHQLLPQLQIESANPSHPVIVHQVPAPWETIGTGNYAAVFSHPNAPEQVVKIYAPGRPGWADEVEVYRRLGSSPAFSECLYAAPNFLVLKRLYGITLYDCVRRGIYIPNSVIQDVDQALAMIQHRGLYPHDVHGRNVIMYEGRGFVVDVSDFLNSADCNMWTDLKRGYYWLYRPIFSWAPLPIPYPLLSAIRMGYRKYNHCRRQLKLNIFGFRI